MIFLTDNRKTPKDSIFKRIFSDSDLFLLFLKDFIDIDWINGIKPDNLQLLPSKYINLRSGNRESDVVYRINMEDKEFYIFILLEHQGRVNQLMPFRLLEYMSRIWKNDIKDHKKESGSKDFKLNPILPVVFYDGHERWTAPTQFQKKVRNYEILEKNTPKFEYKLIDLSRITFGRLLELENIMGFLLAIDKVKKPEEFREFQEMKKEAWEKIKETLKDQEILEIVGECMESFLKRINVPENEMEIMMEMIEGRRVNEMFTFIENYDVQKERKKYEEIGIKKGIKEGKREGKKEGIFEGKKDTAKNLLKLGLSLDTIKTATGLSDKEIESIRLES